MPVCQKFQIESRQQFIQLKFIETGVKSSYSGVNLGFSKLNFLKVMFSQVILISSSRLNTPFPTYILLDVPTQDKLQVTLVGHTLQDYTSLIKNVTVELNTKHCHHNLHVACLHFQLQHTLQALDMIIGKMKCQGDLVIQRNS